jgi:hypothetical protein
VVKSAAVPTIEAIGIVAVWILAPDMLGAVTKVAEPCTKSLPPIDTSDPTKTLELIEASVIDKIPAEATIWLENVLVPPSI